MRNILYISGLFFCIFIVSCTPATKGSSVKDTSVLMVDSAKSTNTITSTSQITSPIATPIDVPTVLNEAERQDFSQISDSNPIDDYFLAMSKKILPTSTMEMVMFEVSVSDAWKSEMLNCYEILKNKTSNDNIRVLLENDKNSYIEYIKNKAEIDIYYEASGVFWGDGDTLGTISRLLRVSIWSDGYRQKTKELFERIKNIGCEPSFIFDEEKCYQELREKFFESCPNAFE